MVEPLTKTEREAMKAIYRLVENPGEATTGTVAQRLGVGAGTASATVKKLAERGLVDHRPYKGIELTASGQEVAVSAIRRHRICERFLADYLGYTWHDADRLASTFEHDLPAEIEQRLYEALGRPAFCPHGFPIPQPEAAVIPPMPRLYDLEPGEMAEVALSGSMEKSALTFLENLGVRPDARVEVVSKQPFDGPLELKVDGATQVLGEKLARQIYVKIVERR
jgi:DtxR family transcriptional regulator, Mn-dependent transcriptional regulator